MTELISVNKISDKIVYIREQSVLLDNDLAMLYDVQTKYLIQAVKRNIKRFPLDFMFQLSKDEFKFLRSQFVTSSWGGRRFLPYAFTEQGIGMLSSVPRSDRAVKTNIAIMRVFVQLRKMSLNYSDLRRKLDIIEKKYDQKFSVIFEVLKRLMETPEKKFKDRIGFHK